MTVVQTVLTFVGIPLAIVAVITIAVYGRSMTHQPNRYRPGKAWDFEPTWYVPHPEAMPTPAPPTTVRSVEGGTTTTAVGGASGEW